MVMAWRICSSRPAGSGFSAMEVGNGELKSQRGTGGGEHFEAVAEEEDQVGFELGEYGVRWFGMPRERSRRGCRIVCTWGLWRRF